MESAFKVVCLVYFLLSFATSSIFSYRIPKVDVKVLKVLNQIFFFSNVKKQFYIHKGKSCLFLWDCFHPQPWLLPSTGAVSLGAENFRALQKSTGAVYHGEGRGLELLSQGAGIPSLLAYGRPSFPPPFPLSLRKSCFSSAECIQVVWS